MSAFLIVQSSMLNKEKFQQYAGKAAATLKQFGAEIAYRGSLNSVLTGVHSFETVAVISFPDSASIKAWYASPAYQELIPNREAAANMTFVCYDAVP